MGNIKLRLSKIFIFIVDVIIILLMTSSGIKIVLYIGEKVYGSEYIQNIHNSTDFNKLSTFDIIIGVDGGMMVFFVGTLTILIVVPLLYEFIRNKFCLWITKNNEEV